MDSPQVFIDEVVDFHVAVTDVLSGAAPDRDAAISALLDRFDPEFTMIPPSGALLRIAELRNLFENGFGAKPGLQIDVFDIEVIAATAQGGLVGYQERQQDPTGTTLRRSTAWFGLDGNRVRWRRLQETFSPQAAPTSSVR
ncbi:DUF4440 domain-containing protein [Nocardia transvalensis]|uniref:DUF4440 domain-containing protein n=1 Tax=Nocardia transvalensis TaxID=37333 RepID=UPI001895E6E0|nr:DUF4440 domain-containing protein [Nocardia transvalensis]MBF6327840.1 DUF4440 domain-containing protein [Nocardia transvalensis]